LIALILASAVLVLASSAIGQGIRRLGGLAGWAWWSPAVGLAAILVICGVLVRLPGRAALAAAGVAVAAVLALAAPSVRRALLGAAPEGLPVGALALLLGLLPYLVSGRTGIPGAGDNNDMSAHLATAWWLETRDGWAPVGAIGGGLAPHGYPIGPHALAAATSAGLRVSLVHAFDAVILVAPVVLALAALGALPAVRRPARAAAALLVAFSYLGASFLVQAAFKEVLEGALLVACALAVRELIPVTTAAPRAAVVRAGLPLGVLLAGSVYVYSYPGLAWPAAACAVAAAAVVLARGTTPRALARCAWPAAAGAGAACAVLLVPEAPRLYAFAGSMFASEPRNGTGNLVDAISPLQALGVWLHGDFRFDPDRYGVTVALGCLAAAAFVLSVAWWWRRRDFVLPATAVAALAIWAELSLTRSIYTAAKGLAVLAPAVAITLAPPLLELWRGGRSRPRLVLAARALSLVVVAGAAASSFLALRDGPVGPDAHARELAQLRPTLAGRPVLFLGLDDFAQWELRGARVFTVPMLYSTHVAHPPTPPESSTDPVGFDSFAATTLDKFDFVVEPAGAYRSAAPANFHLARRTPSYLLWARTGPTQERVASTPPWGPAPGTVLDCDTPDSRVLTAQRGVAGVAPRPITANEDQWRGQTTRGGDRASMTLQVPAGRWDVSLQYTSDTGLRLEAPGLSTRLPATLDRIAPYWPAGTLRQPRSGPLTIRVTAHRPGALARLLAAPAITETPHVQGGLPVSGLALTRHGARTVTVPLGEACGRYVDWYRVG
jgi:hypothetical protein